MKDDKLCYITKLEKISELSQKERRQLFPVTEKFAFRTNSYYQNLIDWDDPDDPIRRIVIPSVEELTTWGELDASKEHLYTKGPGLEHKYEFTAVLLLNDVCGAYCRFCFRKRLFMDFNDEITRNYTQGLNYIRKHKEINNVLLTGGDPLVLSTRKLEEVIRQLREMDHVKIIRIGTKMPAFNPYRILNDPALLEMLKKYSKPGRKIYLISHFNHPRELTREAITAMNLIKNAGVETANQTPLLRGVNDDPAVLGELFNKLSYIGVPPYYLFQCRPTAGNKMFTVPIEEGFEIFEQARMKGSGLAKRARYVMSHASGKIEILGMTSEFIYFRYHRAANPEEKSRFLVFHRNPKACWFDDYQEFADEFRIENSFLEADYNPVGVSDSKYASIPRFPRNIITRDVN
ncbi:MAG: KamA family radical SAM protein [Calditrichia bacterium]